MPIGPNGEKRPAELVANAIFCMKVAIGEAEEALADPPARRQISARSTPRPNVHPNRTSLLIAVARWRLPE